LCLGFALGVGQCARWSPTQKSAMKEGRAGLL
jgi:hypothetical protein